MRHWKKLSFILILFAPPLFAAKVLEGVNDYWKCVVYDSKQTQWAATSTYRLSAINKAYEACKKQSAVPSSCKAAKENCEAYINGMTTRPMWQCMALDFEANPFFSNIYRKKYDAALAARAYCKENSELPDSCYINLITCENLNDRG